MKVYLHNLWERLQTSYWFVPGAMLLSAAGLSFLILEIDKSLRLDSIEGLKWVHFSDAEGARAILSTVAGSMITVAGVVFSVTIVVLTLASNQFGPRLLRNFMQDRSTQVVLGAFTATYLYCLLVLRRIAGMDDGAFVPHLAVNFGVSLAIVNLFLLIYYIHHTAASIQADSIVDRVSRELHDAIDRLFPDVAGKPSSDQEHYRGPDLPLIDFPEQAIPIPALQSGYIQAIDDQRLKDIARQHEIVIYVPHRPGRYLVAETTLAQIWPCEKAEEKLIKAVNKSLILGLQPTPEQDVEFAVRQLVEVAVRALSSGINDPFTAITCTDRLMTGLAILAARRFPSPYHYDEDHRLRLILHAVTFTNIVDAAFNQLRQYGGDSVALAIRLLEGIAMIAPLAPRKEDRQALSRHAAMINDECLRHVKEPRDRDAVSSRYQTITDKLGISRNSQSLLP